MMHDSRGAAWPPPTEDLGVFVAPELRPVASGWGFSDDTIRLTELLKSDPPPERAAPRHRRNRRRVPESTESARVRWLRWSSLLLAATTAVLVAMLSVLGGLISYQPLREAAAPGQSHLLNAWWPLLIYGPWLVASLSILRAALHQRSARHSWVVVMLFSGLAVSLSVAQAPMTPVDIAVAAVPPISALVAFHQIVKQMTLTNPPRHALPRQRTTQHRG
ncbi:DUF2637 domain-containing protein [Streptomyces sp. DSM 44915]|uniref:DUF2637 domain-containing protein n=1 Tax=Streptomyces chisholmiae TaxID=3075540 RepID=A0ABU2JKL5_9ACTN|nr:DUF2637 domain-containing protein [Streptomyces sp. DSM 44915]MDT0265526.1 DUF2637 domain-containing protein [Streptomyces sp. DSM 44915]